MKITNIQRFDKDKDGNPLKTRDGRPYTRLVIEADGKKMSGFDSPQTKDWKVGDEVDIEVEQKGQYWNFRLPKKEDVLQKSNEEILNKLTVINMKLDEVVMWKRLQTGEVKPAVHYPTREEEGLTAEPPF